ncbi:DUF3467 domain-containing protein [Granulicella cerasi]|uniref:DUF3467 domain-containing protein n=1 Tax=Granulicella cerasi TaxID=741063 RepID=A0ABW1Z3K5_9BACT
MSRKKSHEPDHHAAGQHPHRSRQDPRLPRLLRQQRAGAPLHLGLPFDLRHARPDRRRRSQHRELPGIYLSPQQAKALHSILGQNIQQYEQSFGEISLDAPQAPRPNTSNFN